MNQTRAMRPPSIGSLGTSGNSENDLSDDLRLYHATYVASMLRIMPCWCYFAQHAMIWQTKDSSRISAPRLPQPTLELALAHERAIFEAAQPEAAVADPRLAVRSQVRAACAQTVGGRRRARRPGDLRRRRLSALRSRSRLVRGGWHIGTADPGRRLPLLRDRLTRRGLRRHPCATAASETRDEARAQAALEIYSTFLNRKEQRYPC